MYYNSAKHERKRINMRIMGIDYGDARTGIAISDLLCSIVGTTTVIHSRNTEKTLGEIQTNAEKTAKLANGMPYFKFNDYTSSGFDLSWGYDYVMMYFQAGLESK